MIYDAWSGWHQTTKTIMKNTIFAVLIATLSLASTLSIVAPQLVGAIQADLEITNVTPATHELLEYEQDGAGNKFVTFSADIVPPSSKAIDSVSFYLAPEGTAGTPGSQAIVSTANDDGDGTFTYNFTESKFEGRANQSAFDGTYRFAIRVHYDDGTASDVENYARHLAFQPEVSNLNPTTDTTVEFDSSDEVVFSADISNVIERGGADDDFQVFLRHREPGSGGSASSSFGSSVIRDGDTFSRTYSKAELSQYDDGREFEFYVSVVDRRAGIQGLPSIANQTSTGLTLKQEVATGAVENITQDAYYDTIQEAINDANPDDEIVVSDGTYSETVTVDVEGLQLTGPNSGVDGSDSRNEEAVIEGRVLIQADNVTFDGFHVTPPAATSNPESEAILISNTPSDVTVKNNIVSDFSEDGLGQWRGVEGIVAFGGSASDSLNNVTIENNLVYNISGRNIDGGAAGIFVQGNVNGATVSENTIHDIGMESTAPYCKTPKAFRHCLQQ